MRNVASVKPELGVKRRCASCDAPFYDMLRYPINCPKCGAAFNPDAPPTSGGARRLKFSAARARSNKAPGRKAEKTDAKERLQRAEKNVALDDEVLLDEEDDS